MHYQTQYQDQGCYFVHMLGRVTLTLCKKEHNRSGSTRFVSAQGSSRIFCGYMELVRKILASEVSNVLQSVT
ncbi:hypothetical protein QQP08_012883, partial [Theobroma cacao]